MKVLETKFEVRIAKYSTKRFASNYLQFKQNSEILTAAFHFAHSIWSQYLASILTTNHKEIAIVVGACWILYLVPITIHHLVNAIAITPWIWFLAC